MLKKLTQLFLIGLFTATISIGQTLEIVPYGVSARNVAADTTDIFDVKYNGLKNVGVGTKIYLAGIVEDTTFTSPQWNIVSKPAGSNTTILANADMGEDTKIISLIPDVAGTYQIEFSDGAGLLASITVNAGLYLGASEPGGQACTPCHSSTRDKWANTGHANTVQPYIDDETGHFQQFCLSCHTTGYDTNADNNGFDDFDFVFPDSLKAGNYDSLLASYPEAMKRANVQCEACHGPGDAHNGITSDSKMVVSTASKVCAYCHDSGTHHVFPAQYDVSRHANPTTLSRGSRSSCAQCHSGSAFIAWMKNGQVLPEELPTPEKISCAVCHDPHGSENEYQLRITTATLANGYEVAQDHAGNLCINCHRSRRDAVDYTTNYLDNLSSHFGPHHGPQGDIVLGQNAVTWDQELTGAVHFSNNACAGCHMAEGDIDSEGNVVLSGSHSFAMRTPDGVANVSACSQCHGDIGTDFNEITATVDGVKDHDGDGIEEGLQDEVHGLLEQILALIPHDEEGHPTITDSTVTLVQAQAAYNYLMVEEDRSFGIHNPKFVVRLLKLTLEQLNATSVEKTEMLPETYSLEQNYPNPFNPSTVINFSIPQAGDVQLTVYDALGREVEQLLNKKMDAGNYDVEWKATNYSAGIYFYSIKVNNFVATKKMILLK